MKTMLDNDYYKFLMQARIFEIEEDYLRHDQVYQKFPSLRRIPKTVTYKLFNRDKTPLRVPVEAFTKAASRLFRGIRITPQEKEFLYGVPGLSCAYVDWLEQKCIDGFKVKMITRSDSEGFLEVLEISGDWLETILFEVPLMALISEMHFSNLIPNWKQWQNGSLLTLADWNAREYSKLPDWIKFSEFGTRRRLSYKAHKLMNTRLRKLPNYLGTSNVHFSMINKTVPVGTIAHEWFLANFAQEMKYTGPSREQDLLGSLQFASRRAWFEWIGYRGPESKYGPIERPDLEARTAILTDTFSSELFFSDMLSDLEDLNLFRHDSGDWQKFLEMFVDAHKEAGYDWRGKTVMFSDSLNKPKILEIAMRTRERMPELKVLFGVGTSLTNNFGPKPLNIVIKPVEFDGIPVLKVSDDPGKVTGCKDTEEILNAVKILQNRVAK